MDRIGTAWMPESSSLVQIRAIIRKGSGKLCVDGDIGHDILVAIETGLLVLNAIKRLDIDKTNITFEIPGQVDLVGAGLPLFMALHAAATKTPVNQNIAFVGALSQDGSILPIDDINSRCEAAYRAKFEAIVFPMANCQNLQSKMWGNLVLCPIINVTEALVVSVPSASNVIKLRG